MRWWTYPENLANQKSGIPDKSGRFLSKHIGSGDKVTRKKSGSLMRIDLRATTHQTAVYSTVLPLYPSFIHIYQQWNFFIKKVLLWQSSSYTIWARYSSVVECWLIMQKVIRSIPHGGPIKLFLVSAVLHNWYNKRRSMCYHVCGMVHKKDPLLLNEKSSPCSCGSGFPPSLSGSLPYVQHHTTVNKMYWVCY